MKGSYMYTIYKCTFCGFTTDFEPTNCHICGSDDFEQEQRKQTNADRIRAMSNEELGYLLYETETQYIPIGLSVENNWLEWLESEVE